MNTFCNSGRLSTETVGGNAKRRLLPAFGTTSLLLAVFAFGFCWNAGRVVGFMIEASVSSQTIQMAGIAAMLLLY